MKHSVIGIAALIGFAAVAPTTQANNATVENALKNRPELSVFYNGLVSTGIMAELHEGQPYTVFAPVNSAFEQQLPESKYPCFYSVSCKAQVAEILRKHIVPGERHLRDMNPQGGVYSLFSMDNQHIVANEPSKDVFTVDGRHVLSEHQLLGGDLYLIDGIMLRNRDLVLFEAPQVVVVNPAPADLSPSASEDKTVTTSTTDATTPIPY